MKKALLTAATTVALLSSTAYAEGDNGFYVQLHGGMHKLDKLNGASLDNLKSSAGAFAGAGVGYYVNEMLRADLTLEHLFNPKHKISNKDEGEVIKGDVNALLVNGYVSLYDAGFAKFFVGAGLGMSQVSMKSTYNDKVANISGTDKYKKKNNFAYAGYVGASSELTQGIHGTLSYSYKNYGHAKFPSGYDVKEKDKYKGHHFDLGVRFDI